LLFYDLSNVVIIEKSGLFLFHMRVFMRCSIGLGFLSAKNIYYPLILYSILL